MKSDPASLRKTGAWILLSLALIPAFAQPTAPTSSTSVPEDNNVLKLEQFVVSSTATSGYRATNSITATGIGTPIGDTPSTISVVTKDFISDNRLDLINDALRYVPGVVTGPNNESQPFVRGFQGTYTLRNGVFRRQNLTTWNVDNVEVIQGPSSIFYSNIRPGGVINYNTIKPVFGKNFVDVALDLGTYNYRRGEVSLNAGNDHLAVRVDFGTSSTNSFRLNNNESQKFFSFAVSWKPTPNQLLTLEAGVESVSRVNGWTAYIVPLTNSRYWQNPAAIASGQSVSAFMAANYPGTPVYDQFAPFSPSPKDTYGRVTPIINNYQSGMDKPIDLSYAVKISDHLVFNTILNYAWEDNEGINPTFSDPLANNTFVNVLAERFVNVRDSYNVNSRFTYRFEVAKIANTLMVGNDNQWVTQRYPQFSTLSTAANGVITVSSKNQQSSSFLYDPSTMGPANGLGLIANAPAANNYNSLRDTLQDFSGTYIVNQAVLFDKSLYVIAGERYTNFRQHVTYPYRPDLQPYAAPDARAKKWTPQFGALYKIPGQGVSLYYTYSEAVIPQTQVDASGATVQPQTAKGWDVGTKLDLLGGALTGTIDYYATKQTNTALSDSARNIANGLPANATYGYYFYGNAQQVRGIQGQLHYTITQDYQLVVGINHFYQAENVAPQSNALNIGVPIAYQPKTMYNVWNRYAFRSGALKGVVVGAGFHHNAETVFGTDFNRSILKIPGFTVYDAMIGYEFKAFEHPIKLKILGKNVFNKVYRDFQGYYNHPGSVQISASTRF